MGLENVNDRLVDVKHLIALIFTYYPITDVTIIVVVS